MSNWVSVASQSVLRSNVQTQMAYTIDTSKTHLAEAVEMLADSVLNPKYDLHIVKETVRGVEESLTPRRRCQ